MVNGVPREVPRPKPEGPQAPRVLVEGLSDIFILLGSWLYMNVAAELLYIIRHKPLKPAVCSSVHISFKCVG